MVARTCFKFSLLVFVQMFGSFSRPVDVGSLLHVQFAQDVFSNHFFRQVQVELTLKTTFGGTVGGGLCPEDMDNRQ